MGRSSVVEKPGGDYPKADLVNRIVGRVIDLIVALLFATVLPGVAGGFVAISYLLLADGIMVGQSPGKKLAGIKVIVRNKGVDANYRESIVRNLPFAVVAFSWYIPILGYILFPASLLFVFLFELYMAWSDRLGLRIGDVLADTQVVDGTVPIESLVERERGVSTQPVTDL